MRAYLTALATLATIGLCQARADFVAWSYNFTPSALALAADVPGTGGISLTGEPTKKADGTSDVVVTNIRAFSSAPRNNPDRFTHAAYTFTLVLTDLASSKSAIMKFNGFFSGKISATSANLGNTFTPPLTQTVKLGGHVYAVNLVNYAPPGPPTASNAGSISAHVAVDQVSSGGGGGGPPPNAPEPSTLLLSCLGLSGLGLARWRKWRQAVL
jgi:hypothetical protein